MLRIGFYLFFSVAITALGSAQGLQPHNVEGWRLGIVPSALFANVPSFMVHGSRGLSPSSDVGLSLGYSTASGREPIEGVVIRPIYRRFFYPEEGFYFGLQGDLRWTQKDKRAFLDRFGGVYEEYFEFTEHNRYVGGSLFVGQYMDYGKIGFDVGIGIGGISRFTVYRGLPLDINTVEASSGGFFETDRRQVDGDWWRSATFSLYFAMMFEL